MRTTKNDRCNCWWLRSITEADEPVRPFFSLVRCVSGIEHSWIKWPRITVIFLTSSVHMFFVYVMMGTIKLCCLLLLLLFIIQSHNNVNGFMMDSPNSTTTTSVFSLTHLCIPLGASVQFLDSAYSWKTFPVNSHNSTCLPVSPIQLTRFLTTPYHPHCHPWTLTFRSIKCLLEFGCPCCSFNSMYVVFGFCSIL